MNIQLIHNISDTNLGIKLTNVGIQTTLYITERLYMN